MTGVSPRTRRDRAPPTGGTRRPVTSRSASENARPQRRLYGGSRWRPCSCPTARRRKRCCRRSELNGTVRLEDASAPPSRRVRSAPAWRFCWSTASAGNRPPRPSSSPATLTATVTVGDYVQTIRLLELPDDFTAAQSCRGLQRKRACFGQRPARPAGRAVPQRYRRARRREPRFSGAAERAGNLLCRDGDAVCSPRIGRRFGRRRHSADVWPRRAAATLQSVSPLNCTLESDLSPQRARSGCVAQQDGRRHRVRGAYLQARRRFEWGEQVGLVRPAWRPTTAFAAAVRPSAGYCARCAGPRATKSARAALPQRARDFDPAVLYDVLLLEDQPRLEIEADYAQGESVISGKRRSSRGFAAQSRSSIPIKTAI